MNDNTSPVTDDQELAKVLASMNDQASAQQLQMPSDEQPAAGAASSTDTPIAPSPIAATEDIPPIPATLPSASPEPTTPVEPLAPTIPTPSVSPSPSIGGLDDIKRQALDELRPIVGKLDLPAEEKFDALLLVIRSSDDQSLIQAAYHAAEAITDEAKKAQALLDIVKEIEYFSSQTK